MQYQSVGKISSYAENVNAGIFLSNKMKQLEKFQKTARESKVLFDGRIRYYDVESLSKTFGSTRGACNVLEWNPKTYQTRWWYECHNYVGNINRVHPKFINERSVSLPHCPKTKKELLN